LLAIKFRNVAKALRSWSTSKVGSVRLQLAFARETILGLDLAEESRLLTPQEQELHRSLKMRTLGLASLARTIARQRSRIAFLKEGDANTKFFHLQACHSGRKNRIECLWIDGAEVVTKPQLAQGFYDHYNALLRSPFTRTRRIDLALIGLPSYDLSSLETLFTEAEVRQAVMSLPNDKAPGPNGFTGLFYKLAWGIIKGDIMNAVNAFWARDGRSFSHLNGALMVLLKKTDQPAEIRDYCVISLMHSFAKLITKCMANRLAPKLDVLVGQNQSAFIKGQSIHDNFRTVRLSCKEMHAKRPRSVLLKIDVAKAFDTIAWPFQIEVL
jgi:hypothetical protein